MRALIALAILIAIDAAVWVITYRRSGRELEANVNVICANVAIIAIASVGRAVAT